MRFISGKASRLRVIMAVLVKLSAIKLRLVMMEIATRI